MDWDTHQEAYPAQEIPLRKRSRGRRWFAAVTILLIAIIAGYFVYSYHGPMPPTEIYQGITYSCLRVAEGPQSGGLVYLVRADLKVPGVSIYITPMDAEALSHGRRYRLQYTASVVRQQKLAVAVNGTLFESDSSFIRLPGDYANGWETIVADHVVDHVDPNSYLLWWDDENIAHFQITKPPGFSSISRAKWGIAGQGPVLVDGHMNPNAAGVNADHRTLIAADPDRKLVWIAVFDRASVQFASNLLAEEGAKIGVCVDGGTSSAMALGPDAHGVRSGTVMGNWRPVANVFGFRASRIN